jgi:hypothetical protein
MEEDDEVDVAGGAPGLPGLMEEDDETADCAPGAPGLPM